MSASHRLIRTTRLRLRAAEFARSFRRAALALGMVFLAGLLASRCLALLPRTWFTPITLASVIPAAALIAAAARRRLTAADVARTIDTRAGSKELFLTATLGTISESDYGSVVQANAEQRAGELHAKRLVPFRWLPGLRDVAAVAAAVAAAYLWLPHWDPFGTAARRETVAKQEQRLAETKKITAARKQELQEKNTAASTQVDVALAKLDKTLKEMKPQEQKLNAKKLNEEAQDFSELWKKLSAQVPKNAAEQFEKAAQGFGDPKRELAVKEMIADLKKGDPRALQEALQKMRDELAEIAKQPEGAEQKEAMEKLARNFAKVAEQVKQQLGEKGLNEAMQRALEQMDMSQLKDLSKQGMDAANESLQLSQQELERVAEMFKDLQNAEDALKNLQTAKQLNEKGQLDGKDARDAGAESQTDYQKLYEKLLAERGGGENGLAGNQPGQGKSGNNPGVGQGGNMGETLDPTTALKEEKAKSQIGAGKLLMEWKEEGPGEVGGRSDYQAALRSIREGAAEAIRNEQVPAGYHSAIQKYFDRLPAEAPKK